MLVLLMPRNSRVRQKKQGGRREAIYGLRIEHHRGSVGILHYKKVPRRFGSLHCGQRLRYNLLCPVWYMFFFCAAGATCCADGNAMTASSDWGCGI